MKSQQVLFIFFKEKRTSETVPQSKAAENNETARPSELTQASRPSLAEARLVRQAWRSRRSPRSWQTPCHKTQRASSTNGDAKPSTKNGEATEVHPVPRLLPVNWQNPQPCLDCHDNQSSYELLILQFFVSSGSERGSAVDVCCSWAGEALGGKGTPHGHVHGELCSMVNGQPTGQHLNSPFVPTFISLSLAWHLTVAPASLQTRARDRSGPTALARNRPDLGQAALCLPHTSIRLPHSQKASITGVGRRSLSRTRVRNKWGSRECFPGSISIQFLLSMGMILDEESAGFFRCDWAFAFDRPLKSFASSSNAWSSTWSSGISVSLVFKSITNLFDPWKILTQEWVLSLLKDVILISTPCLPWKKLFVTSISVLTLNLLSEGCIHDKLLHWIVLNHQCLSSWNTVHSPQHSEILHPYNINSICLVVVASQSPKKFLSGALSTINCPNTTSTRSGLQKQLCEKLVQSFPGRLQSESTVYHAFCFWVDLCTMEL